MIAKKDGYAVPPGGLVLNVGAGDGNTRAAVEKAYRGVGRVHFKDAFYRKDIAHRALERMK